MFYRISRRVKGAALFCLCLTALFAALFIFHSKSGQTFLESIVKGGDTHQLFKESAVSLNNIFNNEPYHKERTSLSDWREHELFLQLPIEVQEVQRRFRERITHVCKKMGISPKSTVRDLPVMTKSRTFVLQRYKFLFTVSPLCASSTLKRYLMKLNKETLRNKTIAHPHITIRSVVKSLREVKPKEFPTYDKYFRIVFVRNPFARNVAGYRKKFGTLKTSHEYGGGQQYRMILKSVNMKGANRTITFNELVNFLKNHTMDAHFLPQTMILEPCLYQVDYIATHETLKADFELLQQLLGLPKELDLDKQPSKLHETDAYYYSQLSSNERDSFVTKYHTDFEMYGYNFMNSSLYPSSEFV